MKKRIWELDAFRGICILGMVVVHLLFDMVYLYRLVRECDSHDIIAWDWITAC